MKSTTKNILLFRKKKQSYQEAEILKLVKTKEASAYMRFGPRLDRPSSPIFTMLSFSLRIIMAFIIS